MNLRVLDLFSGIGGFSMAAEANGLEVVAHCEIDPFPRAVLAHHWPETPIFPDVREINAKTYHEKTGHHTADIICGGSPCQDLSTAGRQRGLAGGTRSGLFFHQVRIARELGARVIVWENVPGALSSNGGRDFREVIAAFTGWPSDGIEIPADGWGGAGAFIARTPADYNVVYRVFDTRYFRIPQRRRRIFLVAHLGAQCLTQILFDPESLRGNPAAGPETGEDVAAFAKGGFGGYSPTGQAAALSASNGGTHGESETLVAAFAETGFRTWGPSPVAGTLRVHDGMHLGGAGTLIAAFAAAGFGGYQGPSKTTGTITTRTGSDLASGETFIVFENHAQDSRIREVDACPTLNAKMGTGGGNTPLVCVPINEGATRTGTRSHGLGIGKDGEPAPTLTGASPHMVFNGWIIRRLTPLECERLQAFPDGHTLIPFKAKPAEKCADGPRYKACGNAITKDVGAWVIARVKKYYPF